MMRRVIEHQPPRPNTKAAVVRGVFITAAVFFVMFVVKCAEVGITGQSVLLLAGSLAFLVVALVARVKLRVPE